MTDLDDLVARHSKVCMDDERQEFACVECNYEPWPCVVAQLLEKIKELRLVNELLRDDLYEHFLETIAALNGV